MIKDIDSFNFIYRKKKLLQYTVNYIDNKLLGYLGKTVGDFYKDMTGEKVYEGITVEHLAEWSISIDEAYCIIDNYNYFEYGNNEMPRKVIIDYSDVADYIVEIAFKRVLSELTLLYNNTIAEYDIEIIRKELKDLLKTVFINI